MYTVRRIDFEVLGMKGFKVKFGVLENQSELWKRSWKSPEICFGKKKGANPVNVFLLRWKGGEKMTKYIEVGKGKERLCSPFYKKL